MGGSKGAVEWAREGAGGEGRLAVLPFPSVGMVPPGEMVLEHVDAKQVVELLLVPSLPLLLLQLLLPRLHKIDDALAIPKQHYP